MVTKMKDLILAFDNAQKVLDENNVPKEDRRVRFCLDGEVYEMTNVEFSELRGKLIQNHNKFVIK